jgi:hypothetical protein
MLCIHKAVIRCMMGRVTFKIQFKDSKIQRFGVVVLNLESLSNIGYCGCVFISLNF